MMAEDGAVTAGAALADLAAGPCHLDPGALARRWRRSPRTLERWRQARRGPAWLRLEGRVLYRLEDVLAYEQACLQRPSE